MNTSIPVLSDARQFSQDQLDLIKRTIAKGTTDDELALFLHACRRTGLDPLMKQLYAIKRWNAKSSKEEMAIQTGIDGYRLIADRTGSYAGSDEANYLLGEDGFPDVASVTVYKLVGGMKCAFSSSARWQEYCQRTKDGKPTSMWQRMPFLMLGKCAEALALRKAFPAELSGVYTHEEMMQADNDTSHTRAQVYTANKQTAQAKIAELRDAGIQEGATASAEAASEAGKPAHASPAAPSDDPAEFWRAKLRTCERSNRVINNVYNVIPEEIRQDCFACYSDQLKGLKAKIGGT
jgi:phage recombination protein Bet